MKKRYAITTLTVIAGLILNAAGPTVSAASSLESFSKQETYAAKQFEDVDSSAWYASDVKASYELGLMNGRGNGQFDPQGELTVAETIMIAARIHNIYNGGNGVIGASGAKWYSEAIAYAFENKIINENTLFEDYDRNISRGEAAYLFSRTLDEEDLSSINSIANIPDVHSSTMFNNDIYQLYNAGIMSGKDEYGTFQPTSLLTRAEAATIINRIAHPSNRVVFVPKIRAAVPDPDTAPIYYEVLKDIIHDNGYYEGDESSEKQGLVYATLADFDGDSQDELYVIYFERFKPLYDQSYTEEIWSINHGKAALMYSNTYNPIGIANDRSTEIARTDSKSYVVYSGHYSAGVQGMEGYGQMSESYMTFHTLEHGEYIEVAKANVDTWYPDYDELPVKKAYFITVNGEQQEVPYQQYQQYMNQFLSNQRFSIIDGGYGAPSFTIDLSDQNKQLKDFISQFGSLDISLPKDEYGLAPVADD